MASRSDYYEVLGVERGASPDEIKKAYRAAARQYHPDRNQHDPDATERFKAASEAYSVLSDPQKRATYDRHGHAGLGGGGGFENVEDIFRSFGGGIFEEFFGGAFGGRGRGGAAPGDSYETTIKLNFAEVVSGVRRKVEIDRREPCDDCNSTGSKDGAPPIVCVACGGVGEVGSRQGFFVLRQTCATCGGRGKKPTDLCPKCQGSGLVRGQHEIEVDVPAGVRTGERLRLRGYGDHGAWGGPAGDLFCVLEVEPHPYFQRHEEHLLLDLPVTYPQLALGAKIEVPTLEGKTLVTIPRGAQHDEIIRLKGLGFPMLRRKGRGDQLVRLKIDVPTKLSGKEEKLLRELAELNEVEVSAPRKKFFDRIRDAFEKDEGGKK